MKAKMTRSSKVSYQTERLASIRNIAKSSEDIFGIKTGWECKKLGEVSVINYGYTESASAEPIGPRFLRITDIQESGVNWENVPYCKIQKSDEHKYQLTSGDIVFARTGATTGKSFLVVDPPNAVFASYLIRLRLLNRNLLPEFVSLFFQTADYWRSIKDGSAGSAQGGFNASKLGALQIPIPPLPEQHRIVRILDQAFEAIAAAKANAEKNLQNARALFESHLQAVISNAYEKSDLTHLSELANDISDGDHMPPPKSADGVPFITIGNIEKLTRKIDFSSTYKVPRDYFANLKPNKKPKIGDVLYTVTGSFGIPVLLDEDLEFCFQRHIGLIRPKPETNSEWLYYLLLSPQVFKQAYDGATGTAQKTVSLKVLRGIKVPKANLALQKVGVAEVKRQLEISRRLESIYKRKIEVLDELKKSLLHKAFSGELTASTAQVTITFPAPIPDISPTDLHAGILALAYQVHQAKGKLAEYGHVKAEKIAHMVEAHWGIDLERAPIKDAAGPNDFPHLKRVEHRAQKAGFFEFHPTDGGPYRIRLGRQFDKLVQRVQAGLGDRLTQVTSLLEVMAGMKTRQAEIFATVYAAWNNLLLEHKPITDEAIVYEARENWHPEKLKIPRDKFFAAIEWMRKEGWVPRGTGEVVVAKGLSKGLSKN